MAKFNLTTNDCFINSQGENVIYFVYLAKRDFSLLSVQWHHKKQLPTCCQISSRHLDHLRGQIGVHKGPNNAPNVSNDTSNCFSCYTEKKVYRVIYLWPPVRELWRKKWKGQRNFISGYNTLKLYIATYLHVMGSLFTQIYFYVFNDIIRNTFQLVVKFLLAIWPSEASKWSQ